IANEDITFNYQLEDEDKLQYHISLVQACDKILISYNGYQKLAAIDSNM
ncbi:12349_t:CDS:1, partial [Gigaspora margarita]